MSTSPGSRRKPLRSLVPYGNRVEDGLLVRAAIPADILDVLDVLFVVSSKPAPDAKAINRGLLPYVTRLANLGPVRDGLEFEIVERQAHHVWKQPEPVVRLEAADDLEEGGEPSVPQALFDVVMRGLLVGTLVGAGGPHGIRRFLRRFKLDVPAGKPGHGDAEAQKIRDRLTEATRIKGYGRTDVDAAAQWLVARLAERMSRDDGVGPTSASLLAAPSFPRLGAPGGDDGSGVQRSPSGSPDGSRRPMRLSVAVYGGCRVRRVEIDGIAYLCIVDILAALGYGNASRHASNVKRSAAFGGPSAFVDVPVENKGVTRRVGFMTETTAVIFVVRSHAAAEPGSSQHVFARAVIERALGSGRAMEGPDLARQDATAARAARVLDARVVRLSMENREYRRIAAQSRKAVEAMQDEVLVARGRVSSSAALGQSGLRDAEASRIALKEVDRKLAAAERKIQKLCGDVVAAEGRLRTQKAAHAAEFSALQEEVERQGEIAKAALDLFPESTFKQLMFKRGH